MPPDHGAVTARVLGDERLRRSWIDETAAMTASIAELRSLLARGLAMWRANLDFGWLSARKGAFSLPGLEPDVLERLQSERHVYTPPDGRINVAGVSRSNVDYVAESIAPLMT